jgi:hypothetical protein
LRKNWKIENNKTLKNKSIRNYKKNKKIEKKKRIGHHGGDRAISKGQRGKKNE